MSADLKKINMSVFKGNAHNVWMDQSNSIKELLQSMNTAENIEDLRMKFSILSEHMISLAYSFRPVDQTMYVQYCSMANNNSGANWLSISKEIHNPYYGSAMQSCGETIDSITK
jgi:Cu(I)/Ag(I) efflux system membrane fusion protein